jgi:23S rRNA (uracil1939-C5)-methyltransferase
MDPALTSMFQTLELDPGSFGGVALRAGENTGDRMVILESDDPEVPEIETDEPLSIAFRSGDATVPLVGKELLTERIGARTFYISPDAFFQVNTSMAGTLVELVAQYLEPRPDDVLLDAFSGVGLFGLTLAPHVARVIEIEENLEALDDARDNAPDLNNVEFHAGRVEQVLPNLDTKLDLVVADPPRAGLERAVLEALAARKPRTIAYVSCDPATLARDVARLLEHGYRLDRVQPVDLFPQTFHIECVARLVSA